MCINLHSYKPVTCYLVKQETTFGRKPPYPLSNQYPAEFASLISSLALPSIWSSASVVAGIERQNRSP